jgi:TonB family protein
MGYQGTATLLITEDPTGRVTDVRLKKSSGYKVLDDEALDHVRKHLRLRTAPGEVRHHLLDIVFKLQH